MVIRTWRGQSQKEKAPEYFKHVTETVFPSLKTINGFKGAHVLKRNIDDKVEFLVVTLWESIEAIREFAGEDVETAVVEPAASAVLIEFDDYVKHYEHVYDHNKGGNL